MTPLVHSATALILSFEVHLEQVLSVLFRDADPLIPHLNVHTDGTIGVNHCEFIEGDFNNIPVFGKLDRVLHQIDQNLLSPHFVHQEYLVRVQAIKLDNNSDYFGLLREHVDCRRDNGV